MLKTLLLNAGATLALTLAAVPAFAQELNSPAPTTPLPTRTQEVTATSATSSVTTSTGLPPHIALRKTDDYGNPVMMSAEAAIADLTTRYGGTPQARQQAIDDVRTIGLDNVESCSSLRDNFDTQRSLDNELKQLADDLAKEPKKRARWSIGRMLLGVLQIGAAVMMPYESTTKILYTLMVAAGQAQTVGDRVEYDRIMGLYQRYMEHYTKQLRLYSDRGKLWDVKMARWCSAMARYDSTYATVNTAP